MYCGYKCFVFYVRFYFDCVLTIVVNRSNKGIFVGSEYFLLQSLVILFYYLKKTSSDSLSYQKTIFISLAVNGHSIMCGRYSFEMPSILGANILWKYSVIIFICRSSVISIDPFSSIKYSGPIFLFLSHGFVSSC